MRFDFVIDAIDRLFRVSEEDKKADMQLPPKIAAFGVTTAIAGLFLIIISIITSVWSMLIFAAIAFLVSAFAFLCYKFRRIFVLSDTEFSYTNFFGRMRIYKFEHIRGIKMSSESHTLIMNLGRIRIESPNIISDRLRSLFNKELERVYRENLERKNRKKAQRRKNFIQTNRQMGEKNENNL